MNFAPNSLAARDIAYSLHPYTNLAVHEEKGPHVVTGGEGIYVIDDNGDRFIEGLAGLWCASLGFSEPRLVEAARKQMEALPFGHSFTHRASVPVIELSEALMKIAPEPLAKAYFVNSGSEAVEMAIKVVWYFNNALGRPEKKRIIARKRAYHGVTVAAGSLSRLPYVQDGFDLPRAFALYTETPHHYRGAETGESEEAYADRLAADLDRLIEEEGPETIGAFIAEPVMGAGGVLVPPATYFPKIQEVLAKHDVLMIADEVICGFGRTGNMFGSHTFDIKPDILTCAKALSAGFLPIGATLISDRVFQGLKKLSAELGVFGTGNTYGGHPVSAAVALETLRIYEERGMVADVQAKAPRFQRRLKALADHPLVGEARGVGLIGALELVADKATKEPFPATAKAAPKVVECLRRHGVLTRALPGDGVALCPPLIISDAEIGTLFDALGNALDDAMPLIA